MAKILSDPGSGLTGRAAEALILLVAVLTASTLLLLPGQGTILIGVEVLAVAVATWGWIVALQFLRLRSWRTMNSDLRVPFVVRVALGQMATLPYVIAGITVLAGGLGGLYWLAVGMIVSILVALFGAWVLLIEINR